ncbi:hypothetical protein PIB30_055859 [Stylosanthes scabra]|uniref:Uncharacterized protein n=1 Tax=Stylosanthes scabra TaxID=79078 RepID=A0ABU6SKV1_9FABA|nr:hypothetical protein [Stylosanthes scabra]
MSATWLISIRVLQSPSHRRSPVGGRRPRRPCPLQVTMVFSSALNHRSTTMVTPSSSYRRYRRLLVVKDSTIQTNQMASSSKEEEGDTRSGIQL